MNEERYTEKNKKRKIRRKTKDQKNEKRIGGERRGLGGRKERVDWMGGKKRRGLGGRKERRAFGRGKEREEDCVGGTKEKK